MCPYINGSKAPRKVDTDASINTAIEYGLTASSVAAAILFVSTQSRETVEGGSDVLRFCRV